MRSIEFADKSIGDAFTAENVNEIKETVNENAQDVSMILSMPINGLMLDGTANTSFDKDELDIPNLIASQTGVVFFSRKLPLDYKPGTNISICIDFIYSGSTIADVALEITAYVKLINAEGTVGVSQEIELDFTVPEGTASDELVRVTGNINGTGVERGAIIAGSIQIETAPSSLWILGLSFQYTSDHGTI